MVIEHELHILTPYGFLYLPNHDQLDKTEKK